MMHSQTPINQSDDSTYQTIRHKWLIALCISVATHLAVLTIRYFVAPLWLTESYYSINSSNLLFVSEIACVAISGLLFYWYVNTYANESKLIIHILSFFYIFLLGRYLYSKSSYSYFSFIDDSFIFYLSIFAILVITYLLYYYAYKKKDIILLLCLITTAPVLILREIVSIYYMSKPLGISFGILHLGIFIYFVINCIQFAIANHQYRTRTQVKRSA